MAEESDALRLIKVPDWFAAPQNHFTSIGSVIRTAHVSVAEAEAQAATLLVAANYGSYLNLANLANEVLLQLWERNLPLPISVIVHVDFFERYGQEAKNIPAMGESGVLIINPGALIWADPIAASAALRKAGFWSTPHPLHAFFHEIGHLLRSSKQKRKQPLTPGQASIAAAVSDYALVDADEFVAEMFVGLMCGVQYDPEMLTVYRRLGGRVP